MKLFDWDSTLNKIREKMKEPNYQHEGEDWLDGLIIAEEIILEQPIIAEIQEE